MATSSRDKDSRINRVFDEAQDLWSVTLTQIEILWLTDKIDTNNDNGAEGHEVDPHKLLLKLSSGFLETTATMDKRFKNEYEEVSVNELQPDDKKDPTTRDVLFAFTQNELFILRSKVVSSDKTKDDGNFGINLLRKLYSGLNSLENRKVEE